MNKHQIGEILNIESYDGEFYVYGHITDPKQILDRNVGDNPSLYPTSEDIEFIQADIWFVTFKHEWVRCIPTRDDEHTFQVVDAKKHTRGAMPVTLVEMK